ncbi:hypothetical protein E2562_030863 [Oryza meyeriana var. granulata]|uniref:Uncharacterized protein n=1 Tax=Oryza meyeriana var. granulata TaxID=110450 RepID=A0A6G1EZY2_9ORYZ|nr:hypothetical protein E2562_030863 [Oryza meyeriana var. granulata]
MALQGEASAGGDRSAPASGRRRLWSTVLLCFGCSHDKEAAAAGRPRRKRTVPVDGAEDEKVSSASPADWEMRRGEEAGERPRRRRGCCFLLPLSCFPGLKRNVKRSNSNVHGRQRTAPPPPPPPSRSRHARAPPAELPPPRDVAPLTTRGAAIVAETAGAPPTTRERAAVADDTARSDVVARARASASCHGEFGPAVGVCVVAAVSMAGLLGRRLWAIVCVCAWFATLYGLRLKRRRPKTPPPPPADGGGRGEGVVDVNSKDYKKGLLQRDRR